MYEIMQHILKVQQITCCWKI